MQYASLPYGYRHIGYILMTAVFGILWLLITYLFTVKIYPVTSRSDTIALFIIVAGTLLHLNDSILKPQLRGRRALKLLVGMDYLLGIIGLLLFLRFLISLIEYLEYTSMSLAWREVSSLIAFKFFITYLIIAYVPSLFGIEERIKEHSFIRQFYHGHGGSARWAGMETYRKRVMKWFKDQSGRMPYGHFTSMIFLGRNLLRDDPEIKLIGIDNDAHNLTIGMPGSGKSTTTIYPNLAYYNGSAVVIDPKGEHAKITLKRREGRLKGGYNFPEKSTCYMLDPFGINRGFRPSSFYNPLLEIDPNNESEGIKFISAIAEACVEQEEGKNIHFSETSRNICQGVIVDVITTFPKEKRSLALVLDLICGVDPVTRISDYKNIHKLIVRMSQNNSFGGLAQQAAHIMEELEGSEKGGMTTTMMRSLKWIGDPAMRNHLSKSDFSFRGFGVTGHIQTVYIVIPLAQMIEQRRWLRLITSISIAAMLERPIKPAVPTLYILDEFPQLGKLEIIRRGFVTFRDAKIKLWCFIQSLSQLKANIGQDWSSFISASNTIVYGVGLGDLDTAEWLSKSLGDMVDEKGKTRPLLSAAEVMNVLHKGSNLQVVLAGDAPDGTENLPMLLERLTYKPILPGFSDVDTKGHFSDW